MLTVLAALLATYLCFHAFRTFSMTPLGMLNSATWLVVAGLMVASTVVSSSPHQLWRTLCDWTARRGIRLPVFLLAIGLGLLTAVRFSLRLSMGGDFSTTTTLLWVCAITALLTALWPQNALPRWNAFAHAHRTELGWLLLATAIAAGLRFYQLGALPDAINGDEGLIGTWALDMGIAIGALTTPFASMDGVGTNYLYVMKGVFWLFGANPFTLRLLPAIAGTLAIPATYLCARSLIGQRGAWIAVLLLLVSHVHIHFSRTVAVSYTYATLFVPLGLYMLLSGLERRSPFRLALAALAVGVHITIYVDGWVWLVLQGLLLISWAVVDRRLLRGNSVNLVVLFVAMAIIIAPMVVWGLHFPNEFNARLSADGTFSSGWLEREVMLTGHSAISIVWGLLVFALKTFSHQPFMDFYNVGVPTLDPISRYFWAAGLVLALVRTWDRRMLVVNGWFWGGVFALGITTVPPSTYSYRLLVVLPAACILVGLAVDTLLRLVERQGWISKTVQRTTVLATVGVLVAGMATLNITTYFDRFANGCVYLSPEARHANLLGRFLGQVPRNTQAILLPTQEQDSFYYGPHLSVDFLSGRLPITNVYEPLSQTPPTTLNLDANTGFVAVAVPARKEELQSIANWLPGGYYSLINDCGNTMLYVYHWMPPASSG